MKRSIGALLAVAAATAGLVACNNGNNTITVPNCTAPALTVMIYPVPSSRVPLASATVVYVASQSNQLANGNYSTAVQPPNGGYPYSGANFISVAASQLPKGAASPGFSKPYYYASTIGGLTGSSTYTIFFAENQNCIPVSLGTFTTGV